MFESIKELNYPQEYEKRGIIILDDLNEKEMNDPRVQAMFKRSRHNILSIFIISQDYYELPRRTIRANGKIYHIYSNQTISETYKIFIKIERAWE